MADIWNMTGENAVEQGSRLQLRFTVLDGLGAPIFAAGSTPKMQIRASQDKASTLICDFGVTASTTISYNSATGDIDCNAPASVTDEWTFTSAYYDVEITQSGATYRVAQGDVALNKNTTQ